MDPEEPGSESRNANAARYLARLSDSAIERRAKLVPRILAEGEEFVARVALDPLSVESGSPTAERAAQFQGVYEQLVTEAVAFLAARQRSGEP
jgi:hypothetical protein